MPSILFDVPEGWAVHVPPLFVVATIVPRSPTAKQALALGQLTPLRKLFGKLVVCKLVVTVELRRVHVAPRLVVTRISPPPPTATQVCGAGQLIPAGLDVEDWVQVLPPSVVKKIPLLPTAKQMLPFAQLTPPSPPVPGSCTAQVAPPSVVATTTPTMMFPPRKREPVATHVIWFGQLTELRSPVVPED